MSWDGVQGSFPLASNVKITIEKKVVNMEKAINIGFKKIQENCEIKGTPITVRGHSAKYIQILEKYIKELTQIRGHRLAERIKS